MKSIDAIAYYDGNMSLLARALGITPQAVYNWGDVVPLRRAKQIEKLTNGDIRVMPRVYVESDEEVE